MRTRWIPALAVAVLLTAAGCASTTARTPGQTVDDALTTAAVKARLAQEKLDTLARVDVDTNRGVVTLNGTVDSDATRSRIGELTRQVGGVREVVNNLRVAGIPVQPDTAAGKPAPAPAADRESRWRAASTDVEASLSEIRARASREAALQNRDVAYESVDGFQRVEARPLAGAGPRGCRQVQERVYQNGQLLQDRPTEVCS